MTDDIRKQTFLENTQQPTPNTHLPVSDTSQNNKRIAKNTLLLYFRMFLMMATTLYTSRVVLRVLGVEDYGIYNVVGGIVSMFGFITGCLSSATQRYITYELGVEDKARLKKIFSLSVINHLLTAGIILLLSETIGLWFVCNKIQLPPERFAASLWVYQCTVFSALVMMLSVPYNAAIIAHEKMGAFAYISIIDVLLKLLIVFLLQYVPYDRLILYAILMMVAQLLIQLCYMVYCGKQFEETKVKWVWDKRLFVEMLAFGGWNVMGNLAYVATTQGINILLNMFFGPAVNAARGIAVQVQNAVTMFSNNFQTAVKPQIIKTYARGELESMHKLIQRSGRFSFYLLLFLVLPIFIRAHSALILWLDNVPEHTVPFLRLVLCSVLIECFTNPFMVAATATGKIKVYQTVVGTIMVAILPISYIFLRQGFPPETVFVVHLTIYAMSLFVRLYILHRLIKISISQFIGKVIIKCIFILIVSLPFPLSINTIIGSSLIDDCVLCVCTTLSVFVSVCMFGLDKTERVFFISKVKALVRRMR